MYGCDLADLPDRDSRYGKRNGNFIYKIFEEQVYLRIGEPPFLKGLDLHRRVQRHELKHHGVEDIVVIDFEYCIAEFYVMKTSGLDTHGVQHLPHQSRLVIILKMTYLQ